MGNNKQQFSQTFRDSVYKGYLDAIFKWVEYSNKRYYNQWAKNLNNPPPTSEDECKNIIDALKDIKIDTPDAVEAFQLLTQACKVIDFANNNKINSSAFAKIAVYKIRGDVQEIINQQAIPKISKQPIPKGSKQK